MRFTFIKLPKHRQFHYSPLYYDEAKEERKERERRIREEMGIVAPDDDKVTSIESRVRGKMRRKISTHFEVSRNARRVSNLRLVIILVALFILFYYLLKASHEWFERFF